MVKEATKFEWYEQWIADETIDGRGRVSPTHTGGFAPCVSRFAATPSSDEVLGNESSDAEFLRMRDAKLRAAQFPVPSFELAAQKQVARREFHRSGLPTACYSQLLAAEEWRLSDRYESIVPGSKEDQWRATVSVRVNHRRDNWSYDPYGFSIIRLQFTNKNQAAYWWLVRRFRIRDSGNIVPIRFSFRFGKWVSDSYSVKLINERRKRKLSTV